MRTLAGTYHFAESPTAYPDGIASDLTLGSDPLDTRRRDPRLPFGAHRGSSRIAYPICTL